MSAPQVVVGEFYGWRTWNLRLDRDGAPFLQSPAYKADWTGPTLASDKTPALTPQEKKPRKKEPEPDPSATGFAYILGSFMDDPFRGQHGVHAYRDTTGLPSAASMALATSGVVALSGVVVEGEQGYRAERATIQALWLHWLTMHDMAHRSTRPDDWKVWADWRAMDVIAALEDRYQCPVEMYRPGAFDGWRP